MRGEVNRQQVMMFAVTAEQMVPTDHPLRAIKRMADRELERLSPVFKRMYSTEGRPSIPPERLLKGCLLIALYSIRSERQFCEQLHYNFLLRWFVDMNTEEPVFDASTFAKNKERLLKADVAQLFFQGVVEQAREARLLSQEHFSVDGSLIEAWASMKSFQRKDALDKDDSPSSGHNVEVDFKGEKRSNETHASTTDPEAQLLRKGIGKEAKLCFMAHVLMENRNGLCVDISLAKATGKAEVELALKQIERAKGMGFGPKTVGADKGYDQGPFVEGLRSLGVTPHTATKKKSSALDARTTRHAGYEVSQRVRKRIETIFGWMKTVGGFRKTRYKGVERTGLCGYLTAAAYNLVRMSKLLKSA